MRGLRQILGAMTCGVLFCVGLGLPDVASSAESKMGESGKAIIGQVLRIEGNDYVVKNKEDGKEIHLYMDKTTKMNAAGVTVGDGVMAKVDDQNHVDLIFTDQKNVFR